MVKYILFSGKRKSGKDYVAAHFSNFYQKKMQIVRLSAPLKKAYAEENGLNYENLMTSGSYKEAHRENMVKWGENKRHSDPYFFCNLIFSTSTPTGTLKLYTYYIFRYQNWHYTLYSLQTHSEYFDTHKMRFLVLWHRMFIC